MYCTGVFLQLVLSCLYCFCQIKTGWCIEKMSSAETKLTENYSPTILIINHLSHLATKHVKHWLIPGFQMWGFVVFLCFMSLQIELLFHDKQFEEATFILQLTKSTYLWFAIGSPKYVLNTMMTLKLSFVYNKFHVYLFQSHSLLWYWSCLQIESVGPQVLFKEQWHYCITAS